MRPAALRVALAAIGIALLTVGTVVAQAPRSIRGQVLDPAGRPLEGVQILLPAIPRAATTSAAGGFLLDSLPPGDHQLIARLPGYSAVDTVVTVGSIEPTIVTLRLREVPQQLEPVEVTGARDRFTITGFVHDLEGRPLESAEIVLGGVSRTVLTDAAGTFRFDGLPAQDYRVTARRPGYVAAHTLVEVGQTRPAELAFRLRAIPVELETVEVTGERRKGLHGVVGTRGLQPVAHARVEVHGGGTGQTTDSAGRFDFPDLKPGDYLVEATRAGMSGRPVYASVPRGGSREIALTLSPIGPGQQGAVGMRWVYHDLGTRLAFTPSSTRMNRDELARHAGRQLCDIARIRFAAKGSEAAIVVDGVQLLNPWSLCAFSADELAIVEFSGACVVRGIRVRPTPGLRCVMVWTR